MNKADLVIIRDMIEDDLNFVYATFLRGLYYGNEYYNAVDKRNFMANYKNIIENKLSREDIKVKIAAHKEDFSNIFGYAILDTKNKSITWVFVKKLYRNIGIAKDLVGNDYKEYNEVTKVGLAIANKKGMKFNPFI